MYQSGSEKTRAECFTFRSRVFRVPEAYFARNEHTSCAAFHLPLGGFAASVPLDGLRAEFSIEANSHDGLLLCRVEQALRHVRQVRHGDSIPMEIIDGTASWRFDPQHHDIARGRIWFALMHWAGLEDEQEPPLSRLVSHADSEAVLGRKQQALDRLAKKAKPDGKSAQSLARILEQQAREYAFIEALREHFRCIFTLRRRFAEVGDAYAGTPEGVAEYGRILALCQAPLRQANTRFKLAKEALQDALGLVQDPQKAVNTFRDLRDELHCAAEKWHPVAEAWNKPLTNEQALVERRRQTYRFLAQNWAHGEDWNNPAQSVR